MPVDVASGAVHLDAQDFAIRGRAAMVWSRRFDSALLTEADSPLGPGWTSPHFAKLTRIQKDYHFRSPTGALIIFPDPNDSVERYSFVRDFASFHEIKRVGNQFCVTQWNDSGKVKRFHFLPGRIGAWWALQSLEDAAGNGLEYSWDENGRLKGLRQKLEKRTIVFLHSQQGRLQTISFLHPDRRQTQLARYEYDSQGRLSAVRDPSGMGSRYEYDRSGRLHRELAKDGGVFTYSYDDKGRCIRYSGLDNYDLKALRYMDHTGWTEVTNSRGNTHRYERLPSGQIIQEIDPAGAITTYAYDEFGRLVSKTDPLKNKSTFVYDEAGNRSKIVNAAGEETAYEYNESHLVTCEVDAAGGRWERKYDESNRVVEAFGPNGKRYSIAYDFSGNPVEIKKPDGAVAKRKYSASNDLISSWDWKGNRTDFKRDEFGRITYRKDPDGSETEFKFNPLGKLSAWSDSRGRFGGFEYDAAGNISKKRSNESAPTIYRFGTCRRLLEKTSPIGSVRYEWGSEPDQLLTIRNEKGEAYSFEYDSCGRVIKERGFDGRETEFKFDLNGRCIRKINALGERIEWALDPVGRLLKETLDDSESTIFEYDKLGNLRVASNPTGDYSFERDDVGRIVAESQNGFSIRRKFGDTDEVSELTTDAGIHFRFGYDANERISSFDANGIGAFSFKRDASNRIISTESPSGVWEQDYDTRGRLTRQFFGHLREGATETLVEREFSYDDADLLRTIEDKRWGASKFAYDEDQCLIRYQSDSVIVSYRLDETGDPIGLTSGVQEESRRTIGKGGALLADSAFEYEYDKAGRLISKKELSRSDSGKKWHYVWDAKDRLRRLTLPTGEEWEYQYDPFGRRIRKKSGQKEIRFIWNGNALLHEIGPDKRIRSWGFDPAGFRPIFKLEEGKLSTVLCDHLGTPKELVNENGKVTWSLNLDPWGSAMESVGDLDDCPFRFQGQYFDQESGLHYSTFRYYDPQTGRFISQDPVRLHGGLSLYQYAKNPLRYIDPLGLCPDEDEPSEQEKKIAELQAKLEELAEKHLLPKYREIDPNLEAGYTGSFKTGTVGNPNKPTFGEPINLAKFDIDYWIKSDTLYEQKGNSLKADPEFRQILADTPGFEGLKPNKEGFSIKFKPSDS